jgi:hypothetical protein
MEPSFTSAMFSLCLQADLVAKRSSVSTLLGGSWSHLVAAVFLFLIAPTLTYGGAWVQEPNHFMSLLSMGFMESANNYDRLGDKVPNQIPGPSSSFLKLPVPATYRQYDATLYLEYGLPADFELDLSLPFLTIVSQEAAFGKFQVSGISDMNVGLKYLWFYRPWLLSALQVEVGVPVGNTDAQDRSGTETLNIPLGDDEWDVAIRAIASRSFDSVPIYVTADFGYRFRRLDRGSNDLPWSVEGGYSFYFDRTWLTYTTLSLNFSGFLSLGETTVQDVLVLGTSRIVTGTAPNQELIQARPGLFIGIWKKLSLGFNYVRTLAGKNTSAGWGYRIGLMWQN